NKGLDELILMENAGLNLAKLIKKEAKKIRKQYKIKKVKILFLLGGGNNAADGLVALRNLKHAKAYKPVSYTHLRAHETPEHLVCRLLLEKKKNK
ncbi:NAD(P)H-hydrate epimerase, partial [Campylobacter coli]|uniref:NAD(P)H-hydrate epimerase n=1 Tax=Campylobacter coli TaxID=195 RepID=UPI000A749771